MEKENKFSRRSFLKGSVAAGVLGSIGISAGSTALLSSCSANSSKLVPLKKAGTYYVPDLMDKAKDGQELKAGVIGCGGRGSGAAFNFLDAANGVTIVAVGDVYKEKADNLAERLKKEKGIEIPANRIFSGLDAYKQVIDSDIDVVIIATPPVFRPVHFKYATEKGKHAFLEKPICVDPAGYRSILVSAKQAAAKNLCVVTGTQRHHQRSYVEAYKKVMDGMIGEITGGVVYWNGTVPWFNERKAGWTDFDAMVKDWVNWKWLSGDHIVEQHVHNIDVFTWFSGLKPVSAVAFGSRLRRTTGDQFDNFSTDFVMENGVHFHSMCRQIDGCAGNVSEFIQGAKGSLSTNGEMAIRDLTGKVIWKYDFEAEKTANKQNDPYVLEHISWINHIRSKTAIEQASETAVANMAAIMARESAYSGAEITWDNMVASPLDLTPADLNMGKMDMSSYKVPVPGKGKA